MKELFEHVKVDKILAFLKAVGIYIKEFKLSTFHLRINTRQLNQQKMALNYLKKD